MTPLKLNKAFALAGISMLTVRAHIERNLKAVAGGLDGCTAKQLAVVIGIHHTAYTQGQASCRASVEGDVVWIGAGVDRLFPLAALKKIVVASTTQNDYYSLEYAECA